METYQVLMDDDHPVISGPVFPDALDRFYFSLAGHSERHSSIEDCDEEDCGTADLVDWVKGLDPSVCQALVLDLLGYQAYLNRIIQEMQEEK